MNCLREISEEEIDSVKYDAINLYIGEDASYMMKSRITLVINKNDIRYIKGIMFKLNTSNMIHNILLTPELLEHIIKKRGPLCKDHRNEVIINYIDKIYNHIEDLNIKLAWILLCLKELDTNNNFYISSDDTKENIEIYYNTLLNEIN